MEEKTEQVVVITGAGKGIGTAAARAFSGAGSRVALLDIDEPALRALGKELGQEHLPVRCNVADGGEVRTAFREIEARFGRVDCLINNAGIQRYGTVTTTTDEEWDLVMNVNLKSAFLCARSAIPIMRRRNHGVVINVSSVQAFLSQGNAAPYTTSKTALLGLTRSIAVDYAPAIRCVALCPGTVDTPMLRGAIAESPDPGEVLRECVEMHPLKRLATPEEIAAWMVFLSGESAAFMTGQAVRVDGGLGITILGSKRS